ncbi:polysaccharide deacetylase family protein [Robertmurraya kyonggiensis]|nr:polysaccharide deacetylase family protein [Robertmurraya kyonggiensis]
MQTRSRLILFVTLVSLSLIIFSSSTILADYFVFESTAEAKTIGTSNSNIKNHIAKSTDIVVKGIDEQFLITDPSKLIYFTFDDGPTEYTPTILQILEQYQIKSTFFMLNNNVKKNPEISKAVAAAGHTIGCHGVTHKVSEFYKTTTSPRNEMATCGKTAEEITGEHVQIVRVPFGSFPHLTAAQKIELDKAQYVMWDWNVDSNDWNVNSSDKIVQSVLKQVAKFKDRQKSSVILFHDKAVTTKALPIIIESLRSQGYIFKQITVDDEPIQFATKK